MQKLQVSYACVNALNMQVVHMTMELIILTLKIIMIIFPDKARVIWGLVLYFPACVGNVYSPFEVSLVLQ